MTRAKPRYNSSMFNKPSKVKTMSETSKFIMGIVYIIATVTIGLILIAAYFDVLVK